MSDHVDVTEATVRQLAHLAELPLAPGREADIAATLNAWLPMANELSRTMSAADHLGIIPITVFVHQPATAGGE